LENKKERLQAGVYATIMFNKQVTNKFGQEITDMIGKELYAVIGDINKKLKKKYKFDYPVIMPMAAPTDDYAITPEEIENAVLH